MRALRRLVRADARLETREVVPAPFVVGAARSGTTLLRLMLDAHPQLAIPPETHFIPELVRRKVSSPQEFVEVLKASPRWRDWHLDGGVLEERLDLPDGFSIGGALRVFYGAYAARFRKARWGDKTPAYARHLSLIQAILPEAAFIHLIRDPRDVVASVLSRSVPWWGSQDPAEAAGRWSERVTLAREQGERCRQYMEVRFEDLVLSPEQSLQQVCAYLKLPWDPTMLTYADRAAARLAELGPFPYPGGAGTAPAAVRRELHSLTSSPPVVSRIGAWRSRLSGAEVRQIEDAAGHLMVELGYRPDAT